MTDEDFEFLLQINSTGRNIPDDVMNDGSLYTFISEKGRYYHDDDSTLYKEAIKRNKKADHWKRDKGHWIHAGANF
jgi:hypothetical protein